ncbi:MAG: hypothetical protein DRP51_00740 [Candidatus Zixiibacteriota bacterium]|nr:MAG: hypothetical protein DRP51_00740 [candidate division Zixibacteria bacterium]
MPFCPKCRYEYKPEISVCPDCSEPLVSSLPDKTAEDFRIDSKTYNNWVRIGRLTSYAYANMINEGLHSKNIPVVVLSGAGHFGQTGQMGTSSFRPIDGGFSIMVPEEFAVDASREAEVILGDEWIKAREENIGH